MTSSRFTPSDASRSGRVVALAAALLIALVACQGEHKPSSEKDARAQLSIGYSLLYQESDGIPKFKWLLDFKSKPEEMGRLAGELTDFYQRLAESLQKLSHQYPAVRLDATTMPRIESETRKGIGLDLAKDMAPVTGKTGADFERSALLMFHDSLNEQRHLVRVMQGLETDAGLKKFLQTTLTELDAQYDKVDALLNRRYFVH